MTFRVVLCAGIVLCLADTLSAQSSTTWMGPDGGKWSKPSNWSGEILPSPDVKAFIEGSGSCIVDYPDAAAWQVDLAGGPLQIGSKN